MGTDGCVSEIMLTSSMVAWPRSVPQVWFQHGGDGSFYRAEFAEMASGEFTQGTKIICHLEQAMSTGEDSADPTDFFEVRMCHDRELRRERETARFNNCAFFFSFPHCTVRVLMTDPLIWLKKHGIMLLTCA